jgi:hypothetical protein
MPTKKSTVSLTKKAKNFKKDFLVAFQNLSQEKTTKKFYIKRGEKIVKIKCLVTVLLLVLIGCSGMPSGSFPKQVGSFTLVSGPKLGTEDTAKPATYYSEYLEGGDKLSSEDINEQSRMAKTVLYSATPYKSADEARKALNEYKEDKQLMLRPAAGESIKESGGKVFLTHRGGMETIVWIKESIFYQIDSRVPGTSEKFVRSLSNK